MKVEKAGVVLRNIIKGKTYLLLLCETAENYWQLPKGHVDEGETAEETAVREAKEETGFDVNIIKKMKRKVKYFDGNGNEANITYFLAEIKSGDLKPEEGFALKWVSLKDAYKILTYQELKDFIKLSEKEIEGGI